MKELQKQSETWGDVALVLGILALLLILLTWPARSKNDTIGQACKIFRVIPFAGAERMDASPGG
jgi:hypothetical protein